MEPVGVTDEMLLAARHHGANVARVAAELAGKAEHLFARGIEAPPRATLSHVAGMIRQATGGAPAIGVLEGER